MAFSQLSGSTVSNGLRHDIRQRELMKEILFKFHPTQSNPVRNFCLRRVGSSRMRCVDGSRNCSLSISNQNNFLSSQLIHPRKQFFLRANNPASSNFDVQSCKQKDVSAVGDNTLSNSSGEVLELSETISSETNGIGNYLADSTTASLRSQDIKRELVILSLPALAGQAIDPLTQLMETAYIGRLGSVELASAGVSISVFNVISKLFNIPLLSVATSFVAEDIAKSETGFSPSEGDEGSKSKPFNGRAERHQLSSVSTALLLAVGIGIIEALALSLGSGPLLSLMGISHTSPMRAPAQRFLALRALGAPAFVVSLALQGIFRGFKDTKTPMFCLGKFCDLSMFTVQLHHALTTIGNFMAIFLFPLLMFYYQLGVSGAAISTVISQYLVTFSMLWCLNKRAVLLPPKLGELQFGGYLKSGGFLLARTLSVLFTMTLGTSMAARQGPVAMAAHQICLQVWLAVSLLTDALAASAQALVASYSSKGDYRVVKEITHFVLKIGLVTGVFLTSALGVSFASLATLFTKDMEVLGVVKTGVLFVSASQPINALAFIFDGLHYGVSDFAYAARSMMLVGALSSAFLLYAPRVFGLQGVWLGLTLFMGLRMMAGFIRIFSKDGPWWFLHCDMDNIMDLPLCSIIFSFPAEAPPPCSKTACMHIQLQYSLR
nr:protein DETOXIFICATION 45, chloroplastic isoform X1 [Ipomoea batatas]